MDYMRPANNSMRHTAGASQNGANRTRLPSYKITSKADFKFLKFTSQIAPVKPKKLSEGAIVLKFLNLGAKYLGAQFSSQYIPTHLVREPRAA
jgi:hypothetical protein